MTARWVRFDWPQALRGDPRILGSQAGLTVRPDRDGGWRLTTDEQYRGSRSRMIETVGLVSVENADDRSWEPIVRRWKHATGGTTGDLDARVQPALARLLTDPVSTEHFSAAARLGFLALPDDEFVGWFETFLLASLRESLPAHRLVLIDQAEQIQNRVAIIRALFVADNSPAWFTTPGIDPSLSAMTGLVGDAFQGSTRLIDPFLLVAAPWAFGASLTRITNGMAVIIFGLVLPGHLDFEKRSLIGDMITSHLAAGPTVVMPQKPTIAPDEAVAGLQWWLTGMNRVLSHVLDPTLFVARDRNVGTPTYLAHQHMGHIAEE
jgi:hypothetical protein